MKTSVILLLLFTLQVNFCISQNTWTQKTDFGGHKREGAVGFSIGTNGYIGTGFNDSLPGNHCLKDFWEYNPATDTWTQKADFPGIERGDAVGFSIGNKGYIGLGYNSNSGIFFNDFWEYDPTTDTWTQKTNFQGDERSSAVGFSIGTKGYIGTGYFLGGSASNYYKDFWEYNPLTDSWTQKANLGGIERARAIGFSIGTKGYIGTGRKDTSSYFYLKDFWEYNSMNDTWSRKCDFDTITADAVGFSIGSKGYIGTGRIENHFFRPVKDFWEYDTTLNTWSKKADFGGSARSNALGFSIGTKGYIGTGYFLDDSLLLAYNYHKDFWEYSPVLNVNELLPKDNRIKLYRNEANMLTIISPVLLKEVNIYNVLGKKIILYYPDVLQNSAQINVSGLGAGVYFVKIQMANGEIISEKFIIAN